jgi:hypothetical protein
MSDFETIPVVDISGLGGEDRAFHAEAVGRLRHAAEHVGFLYVTGHRLHEPLLAALREAARDFFARPLDEKMAVYIGHSRNHRGYVPEGEEVFAGGTPMPRKPSTSPATCPRPTPTISPATRCSVRTSGRRASRGMDILGDDRRKKTSGPATEIKITHSSGKFSPSHAGADRRRY